jgi:hypothetical protein
LLLVFSSQSQLQSALMQLSTHSQLAPVHVPDSMHNMQELIPPTPDTNTITIIKKARQTAAAIAQIMDNSRQTLFCVGVARGIKFSAVSRGMLTMHWGCVSRKEEPPQ